MISWIVSGLVVLWASRFAVVVGECVSNCQNMANGDYQSCNGCNVYVTCSNELTYDNRPCPAGLVWDDNLKRCEYTSATCSACETCSPDPCAAGSCTVTSCVASCDCSGTNPLRSGPLCQFEAFCDSSDFTAAKSAEGEFVDDHATLYASNGEITAIELYELNAQILGIRIKYGAVWSAWEGSDASGNNFPADPIATQTLTLGVGETITGVSGDFGKITKPPGDGKTRLSQITFTTSTQTWGPFGTAALTQDIVTFSASDGARLAYIDGLGHKSGGIGELTFTFADCTP